MSSNAVRPTWVPFHSTLSMEEKLVFSLRLMSGGCSAPAPLPSATCMAQAEQDLG